VALHAVHITFYVDRQGREPRRLLEDWPTLVDVAEAAQRAGVSVSVVAPCSRAETVTRNGVSYYFFAVEPSAQTAARGSGFESLIRRLEADVFHVHGLCFPADVVALADIAPAVPILLQDHASRPPRIWRPWRRHAWRRGMACASAVSFCASEQSRPFIAAGLLGECTQIYEIPESTSRFSPGDQAQARRQTGLTGDPCLLWVGRLMPLKDPLTVLDGVSDAARLLPGLHLWCCFHDAPLLGRVMRRIAKDPYLRDRVHLLGKVPHEKIELMMRAADMFVAGSRREGSGYALIEALACGLSPVVTDIPSFRSLTGNGSVGRLWPCGDASALCDALVHLASQPAGSLRAAVQAHFDRLLSFDALGRILGTAYGSLHNLRQSVASSELMADSRRGREQAPRRI
jgi:glycosyltransferase involved in cell wall biosynthesis